jgi:multidrug efflux pump subunit AcrB
MPLSERADLNSLASISVPTQNSNNGGNLISLSELVKENKGIKDQTIYHKNMRRVTYVTGDVAKEIESPVYRYLICKTWFLN